MSHYRKSSSYGKRSSSYKTEKHTGVTSRKLSGAMKIIAVLAAFLVVGIGAFSIISALTKTAKRNAVDLEYGSVMSEIADGEKFSIDRFNGYASDPNGADNAENFAYPAAPLAAGEQNGYTAVEIFARLNWRFAQQTQWYGEYHGKVNTVVEQDVQTYKYYRDGMLLSADLTTSSLVSGASQFCYLKDQDRVLWRKPVGGASTYNGMDTAWKTGEPYRNMTISGADGFKAQNGLPAYELSVYVIEGKTVLSAEVEELEDGRFKVTFVMNPNNWTEKDADGNEIVKGANAYYVNQMIFTGGLPEAPEFSALTVAFTFDENWFTYKSEVTEEYSAAYGPIKAPCKAWGGTEYDYAAYGENREYPTAYEDYFCNWADAEVDRNPIQKEITPVNCLADAFGGLLAEPSALSLDLTVNGEKRSAVALLDLSKTDLSDFDLNALEARVGLGALSLWIEDGKVYLKYGNLKASLQLEELVGFFAPDPGEETGGGLDTDALLAALGEGQFLVTDTAAELHSVLPLLGLEIPVDFYFKVDEEQNITLDRAEARIEVGGQTIGAVIRMGGRPISALTEAEKANYPVLNPYVAGLKELFTSNRYRIEIGYTGKDVAVSGAVEIAASPLAVQGAITVSLPASEVSKTLRIMYRDGSVYLDLDGIRIKADVAEAVELIKQYVSLSELTEGLSLDLGKLFSAVLSEKFAANLISEEKDSAFRILVRGTELLGALGLEYELGDVSVSATAKSLSLEALGARITLTEGREFTPDPTDGYTDLLPYAAQIAELVAGGFLHADLSYASDTISVTGGLDLDLHSLAAAAQISVSYAGAVKQFGAVYSDGMLYLTVDGLRVKADVKGAIGIVGEFVDLSAGDRDALGIISDLLSLDFSEFITLGEDKDTLHVAVAGTQLLQALGLGLDLDPGTVELLVGGGKIGVKLMNATVEIAKGNSFTYSTDGYAEIVPYAEKLLAIYRGGYLHADLSYEIAGLALKGEADLDFNTLNVQAALTLSYKNASKEIDILYTQGDILLGVDNLRLAVNAEEAVALLSDALGLEGSGLETEALLSALFGMNFSELIPELWESDGTLHIAVSSGKLLGLFGVKFDLGDLRLALGEDGVTVKLGAAAIALSAGKAFTPETGDYLDVTDYAKAVLSLVKSEAMKIGVSYAGEKLSVSGELVAVPAAKSAKGDFTLAYDGTEHKLGIVILPEKDLYLDLDGIKVRANLNDALTLVKSLLSKGKNAAEPMALDLTEEEADLLERILSFDIATLFSLTETEDTLTLIVQADKILSVLGLGFEIGEAQIDLQKTGKIGVTLLGGDLSASVEGGEAIEIGVPEGYVDVIVYVQYLLDLFDQRTVDVRLGYDGENLDLRGSVSIDTETRVLKGELTLVYKGSVRAASFFYREKVLYLEMGDYKLKADTTAALVMLASYLGFSETEGADYETLAKVFSFDFEGLVSLSENESRDMLTVLIKGNELLAQLGLDLDLGNVAVQLGKGYLHAEVKGATVEAAGSSMPVVVPEFEGYIDVTDYVDVLSGIFKQSALQIAIGYEKDGTKIDGNVFLDIHGKRVSADLRVAANGESFTLGLAYRRENGAPVLYLDLDGAKIKLDVDQLVSLLRGEPEKISTFSAIALESVPQTTALSAETKNKLADLLDKLLSLNLDSYFSLDLSEDGNALTLVAKGTELIEKLFGTVEIFGKEIKLGDIRFTVSKGQNGEKDRIDLSALGATLKLTGISAEEYPALSDPESYADAAVYLGYLKELFANDVLRLTIEDLTFALGGKEIGISGAIDLAKDLSVVGGNLTLTLGEKAIALSLYYEKAEKNVYFGVGGVKIRASVEEIKALIERIKNFGKDQPAGIALASLSFGLFGVAEGDGVLDLTIDGAGLLKLLGVDFDLGDVSLSVKKGSLGVDITGGKFGLKAALTAGDTVAFEADKSSYIAILDYVNYALDLFEKPALNVQISYRGEALTVLGDVTFDLKNKTAEGTLALSHGETRKQVGFVYLDGTMYIDLGGKFKFKAKTTSAALMLAAYLGFSGKDDLPALEIEDLFGDLFESFDSLVSLKEGDGALDILIDGTALLEKLGMKLGNFKLGDIGVEIKEGGLVLGLLGAQIVLTGGETVEIPGEEELAGYTDLSKYVDTVADIFKSGYLDLSVSYSDNAKDELTVTGHLRLAVKEKAARADLTVARGTTKIRIGVVYEEGMLYLDLDGAKLKVDPARAVEFIRGLLAKDAEPAAIAQISMPAVMALDEPAPIGLSAAQKEKLADLLETLFTLELDRFFTVTEEGDALSVVVAGTELLRKLTGKDLDLGSVKIEVTASTYTDQGEIDACGTLTLTALGATIAFTDGEAFEPLGDAEKAEYADIMQYVEWAADIFAADAKRIDVTLSAGDLTVKLGLDTVESGAFLKGTIRLSYRSASDKTFVFVYNKEDGYLYLDLDNILVKAKTEDIVQLFKSLFASLSGKEANGNERIALGYAAAIIAEADELSFGVFSLQLADGALGLAVSGDAIMSLLGEKVQSLLGEKLSLEEISVTVSEQKFSVGADLTAGGKAISLGADVSKGTMFSLSEEETRALAEYIDVFKYGRMVKSLFTDFTTLQADVTATVGGRDLSVTLKFNRDFTMAQGTLSIGSLHLDLVYALESRKDAEGNDVLLYVKIGENIKLMANVSEAIRLIKSAMPAAIALTAEEMNTLERLLNLNFGEIVKLKETVSESGDALQVTLASTQLFEALGIDLRLGQVDLVIEDGQITLRLPDKGNVNVAIYGTSRGASIEKPADYKDITPIVARLCELIEARAIEFSGSLAFGETSVNIEQGIVTWKEGEDRKFYLKGSLGDFVLELLIEGDHAKLKIGNFGIEFGFSEIDDLINAVKDLVERVKSTMSNVKANVTGTASKQELIGSLQGVVDVLNKLIDILKGSEETAGAVLVAKNAYETGGLQLAPSALKPEEPEKELILNLLLGKVTIGIYDETNYENRGFLGLGIAIGDASKPSVKADFNTAVYYDEIPTLTGEFYRLMDFVELLGYAGDAIALVAEPNLTAKVGGTVLSTNLAMYPNDGLIYQISGDMEYRSGGTFPIRLDMDQNVVEVSADLFVHFKLLIEAGTQKTMVNDVLTDTTPKNIYLDIFITDCDLSGEQNGELDFFVTISEVGEGNVGYDPLKLYAPAKEILTILSGAASILGLDSVTYLNEYLIAPLLDGDMVARFRGLGASLVPTILDLLIKDEDPAENVGKIANGIEIPAEAFGLNFGDVQLRFSSEQDGDASFLAALGVTTSKEEAEGEKTYTKTTDLAFRFSRVDSGEKKPADLTGFFDIEGVDELLIALGRTATHLATEDEVIAGIAQEGEYVRNDVFFIDGKLHLDLSIIGINLETIEINVEGLTVNFDAHNKISLNAKLSYQGVHNTLGGLLGDSDIIKGDTTLEITLKGDMLYLRRTQTTHFNGGSEMGLATPEVIYRAFPLKNFMKDTATMMNHLCFMFNLSESLVTRIMDMVGTGGSTPAEKPTDLGGLLDRYITSCTYAPQTPTDGLANLIYTLVLNGAGLTNSDSFGDISVVLGVEKGVLRSIDVPQFSIASVVHIKANLRLRNPEYVWDEGCKDTTESIAVTLEEAMAAKLKSVDWIATSYLEGQLTTVTFWLKDKKLGEQGIVFDPNTKELYARPAFPSIRSFLAKNPEYDEPGYTYEWEPFNEKDFHAGMEFHARAQANTYTLVFKITREDFEKYFENEEALTKAGYTWSETYQAYVYTYVWEYDPSNYIDLPYITTKIGKIIGFRCPNGQLHNEDHRGLDLYNEPVVEFTAEWKPIEYTVTFDFGNGERDRTVKCEYKNTVDYPEDPTREGYRFTGWSIPGENGKLTVTDNVTVYAQWEANTYHVTLVSEQMLENFTKKGDRYEKVIDYVYGSDTALPANIETDGYILTGWSFSEEDQTTHFTKVPLTAHDFTLYAVWKLRGVDVRFVVKAEDNESGKEIVVEIKDFTPGDKLSNLPEVPHRDGYTGVWDFAENYTVPFGGDTIYAKYTGITYYITEYSLKRIDGFEEVKLDFDSEGIQGTSYWKKTYAYVYGGTPHPLTLGVSENVYGFDFDGYYTERFGGGKKIDPPVINDDMIKNIFRFNVGKSDDFALQNVLYANWIDNSVEVHLYSDFDFAGRTGSDIDGYYKSVTKMEGDYDISEETLSLIDHSDLRRLGWWYQDDAGNWSAIDNVEEFRNTDLKTQATVKIFAMWIEDIDITITQFFTTSLLGGAQYTIGGTLTGGLPSGEKSNSIYAAIHMTPKTTGYYVLFNNDGSTSDTPGGKQDITVERNPVTNVGTFSQEKMNSGTFGAFVWTERASYGGVIMRMEFAYGSDSIVFYGGNVVSAATYTVTYHKENDEVIDTVNDVRIGYTGRYNYSAFSDWGATAADLAFDNRTYADELAAANNIACPQDGSRQNEGVYEWPHRAITGNADIYPSFVLDPVTVVFTSDYKFSDAWRASADGKTFTYTTKMRPNSTIEFIANGEVFKKYTVAEGVTRQTFVVPASAELPKAAGVRPGSWAEESAVIGEYGASFIVQYAPDTIIFRSELAFTSTVDGVPVGFDANVDYSVEYSSEYTLLVPDGTATTVGGVTYNFLGWYTKVNGVWSKLPDAVSITASTEPTYAHALWISTSMTLSVSGNRSTNVWRTSADHTINVTVNGFSVVGAPRESVKIDINFRFWANDDTNYEETNDKSNDSNNQSVDAVTLSSSATINKTGAFGSCNKKYGHAAVTITVKSASGQTIATIGGESLHNYCSY